MVITHEKTSVRQRQIVDAARKVIIKYGSEHVTVRKIAEETGVSEGAIYRHFKSKRDILSLMIFDVESALLADFKSLPIDGPMTLDTLETTVSSHMASVARRKGISFQVIAEIVSFGDKGLNHQVFAVINSYTNRIEDILSQGAKSGIIRQDIDLKAASLLFFSMMQGLVNSWALSQYGFDLEEKYASLWKIFREAILRH